MLFLSEDCLPLILFSFAPCLNQFDKMDMNFVTFNQDYSYLAVGKKPQLLLV